MKTLLKCGALALSTTLLVGCGGGGGGNGSGGDYSNLVQADNVTVSTFAGSGALGSVDGLGSAASFSDPEGVAVDGRGNVYVVERFNARIRKISPSGLVTTLAGTGQGTINGNTDGPGSLATFSNPQGITVDSTGTVFVADAGNNLIRKINPQGVVSTFAGKGPLYSYDYTDGVGTNAGFRSPRGVAVDSSGTLYVADTDNLRIRKITSSAVVSTLAGSGQQISKDGVGGLANIHYPFGVAVDSVGNLFVVEADRRIRKITPSGVVTTFAGGDQDGQSDGAGTEASFTYLNGIAIDASDNIYVSDASKIRKITRTGLVTTLAGSGLQGDSDGAGPIASFNSPRGIAVDINGNIYVADNLNKKIRKIVQH